MRVNKRYQDIFNQYIYKGEATPFTIGTLVVCAFCFLIFIIATFTQFNFSHIWFKFQAGSGFVADNKFVTYNPIIPTMIFIVYMLGKKYSYLLFITYLIVGFFIWPIFVLGGGFSYIQNYLFGYLLGFVPVIAISGTIFKLNQNIKARILGTLLGVLSVHICGFIYCFILAVLRIIDFNLIGPIVNVISLNKIIYDILFSLIIILLAPYIKNVFWTCMKPKADKPKKLKNSRKRHQIVSDNVN